MSLIVRLGQLEKLFLDVTVFHALEYQKVDAFGLFLFRDFFKNVAQRDKLNKTMSATDSENGSFEVRFLGFVNDSVVDSKDTLVFVDFSKVSLRMVGLDAGSGQPLDSEHSICGDDDSNIFPIELNIVEEIGVSFSDLCEIVPIEEDFIFNLVEDGR